MHHRNMEFRKVLSVQRRGRGREVIGEVVEGPLRRKRNWGKEGPLSIID